MIIIASQLQKYIVYIKQQNFFRFFYSKQESYLSIHLLPARNFNLGEFCGQVFRLQNLENK